MEVMCLACEKTFSTRFNLNKHTKKVHKRKLGPVNYDVTKWNFKCLEKGCNNSFRHNEGLIKHLSKHHSLKIEYQSLEFLSREDFFAWKAVTEKKEKSYYVMCSTSKSKDKKIMYYKCNRSGKLRSRCLKNERFSKSQGSCKMGRNCISSIKVTEYDTILSVFWIRNHYGHKSELQHLRIPEADKLAVASKLISGVPASRILDSYRDISSDLNEHDKLNRVDLLTRKDISNIKKSYHINISEGVKDENDVVPVDLWIDQSKQDECNPVLFYKNRG